MAPHEVDRHYNHLARHSLSLNAAARGTFLKTLIPLLRPYRSNQQKENGVLTYYDWIQT
jgi:hypothetical protein